MEDQHATTNSSALPTYNGSIRTATAAQAYKRVRRVVQLQWRGIAIVLLIITDVVFFSVVFLSLDSRVQPSVHREPKGKAWILCLIANGGDKNKCLDLADKIMLSQATVMVVLIMLSVSEAGILPFMDTAELDTDQRTMVSVPVGTMVHDPRLDRVLPKAVHASRRIREHRCTTIFQQPQVV